jgi:hypothetical protein
LEAAGELISVRLLFPRGRLEAKGFRLEVEACDTFGSMS